MPSPFPGMDPYLEGDLWQEFHETLASAIRAQLVRVLPRTYVALLAKRYVLDRRGLSVAALPADRVVYPDVHVVSPTPEPPPPARASVSASAAVAEPAVEIPSPMAEQVPLLSIEVRDVAARRLVTIIEILSPANKDGDGAREYAERRESILATSTHLLEIDLVRRGARITLLWDPPPAPYYVYLSRAERRPLTAVWPSALRSRLPVVPIPLLAPDSDVPLDLQATVDDSFALVGYERLLDYQTVPPPPPFPAEDAQWMEELLRTARLR